MWFQRQQYDKDREFPYPESDGQTKLKFPGEKREGKAKPERIIRVNQ